MEPSSRDRIQRMEADGVLTPGQAEMLRDSLAGPAGGAGTGARPGRRRLPAWLTWGLPAALGLGLAVALGLGGGEPSTIQDVTQSLNQPGGHGAITGRFQPCWRSRC